MHLSIKSTNALIRILLQLSVQGADLTPSQIFIFCTIITFQKSEITPRNFPLTFSVFNEFLLGYFNPILANFFETQIYIPMLTLGINVMR